MKPESSRALLASPRAAPLPRMEPAHSSRRLRLRVRRRLAHQRSLGSHLIGQLVVFRGIDVHHAAGQHGKSGAAEGGIDGEDTHESPMLRAPPQPRKPPGPRVIVSGVNRRDIIVGVLMLGLITGALYRGARPYNRGFATMRQVCA